MERYFVLRWHLGVPGLLSFDGIAGENAELNEFEQSKAGRARFTLSKREPQRP